MKKLVLCISMLVLLFIACFYFWDLKNEVSEIKSAVTGRTESVDTVNDNTKEIRENKAKEEVKEKSKKINTAAEENKQNTAGKNDIDALTEEKKVTDYLKENGKLPDYYITKKDAAREGWVAKEGNLCDVLPGRAIGGDIFTNREKTLPVKKGRIWYEADINYDCGRRNARRVVYSNDGLIFVTHDHYKNFEEVK